MQRTLGRTYSSLHNDEGSPSPNSTLSAHEGTEDGKKMSERQFLEDEEVVTSQVKEILSGVYNGERARLAEAITLGTWTEPFDHAYK